MRSLFAALFFGLLSAVSAANVITFDEFTADNADGGMPSDRYADLGITFFSTDDGLTWNGLTAGDPGNWGISGTNGNVFSGFDGNAFGLATTFDQDVNAFSLDVSRSNGSEIGDTFSLQGWYKGHKVETQVVTLGPINQWQTVRLHTIVDMTVWEGRGNNFHPFGVDNVQWTFVPEPATFIAVGAGSLLLLRKRRKSA